MEQDILIPERTLQHIFAEVHLNIANKDNVTGRVIIAKRPQGSLERPQLFPYPVNITDILTAARTANDISAADLTGFKKCLRAICASAAGVTFGTLNEVL